MLRELMRLGHLNQSLAFRYCYLPAGRVRALLEDLGCSDLRRLPPADRSSAIHRFIVDQLGFERATFDRSFDLPLLALASDPILQGKLLGHALPAEEHDVAALSD